MKLGTLFIISAPSGSGKTTIVNHLLKDKSLGLIKSVSLTTRPIRPLEKDGQEYRFISRDKFLRIVGNNGFLEHANVFGNLYGTPKRPVTGAVKKGYDVLLSIDVQGAMEIKKKPGIKNVLIFILPPSMEELKKRLRSRNTDCRSVIRKRLAIAKKEIAYMDKYEYVVVNDNLHKAVDKVRSIIIATKCRVNN